ncbi:MAG: hypothetical protein HGA65_20625, partial [Oscillochloris sp.]|nr:hypothetical protein [Oscillochloris sp.]
MITFPGQGHGGPYVYIRLDTEQIVALLNQLRQPGMAVGLWLKLGVV